MIASRRAAQAHACQALAHPTRIAIVEELRDGAVAASALPGRLQMEASHLAVHLNVLRELDMVTMRTVDAQVYYLLRNRAAIQVLDILKQSLELAGPAPMTPRPNAETESES